MKKNSTLFVSIATTALVIFCSPGGAASTKKYTVIDALQVAKPIGSAFARALAREYRSYSRQERDDERDYPDAIHFARKGLAAAKGHVVTPEPIKDWNLKRAHLRALIPARVRLMTAIRQGGSNTSPDLAAKAQARFDCWVEQREEKWASQAQIPCRYQFKDVINQLERRLAIEVPISETTAKPPVTGDTTQPGTVAMPPVEAETSLPGTQTATEQAVFLTFFDFDKANISSGATNVLDAVADEIKKQDDVPMVNIVGYTDTSGPESYNMKLSLRRARAVRDALLERDIPKSTMTIKHKGEKDLLVPTPDNVREPANRRARISFE